MKGFQQRSESTGRFFLVKHNCICEESSKDRPGYEPVEVMNPSTKEVVIKFIKRYDFLEAMVTKIEWRDTEDKYDQRYMSWKIHLDADSEKGTLEIPFNSRVGDRFMRMAENIDFSKPVEIRAWRDNEDRTAFIIKQDGQNVTQKYTKADPGDCPPPTQTFGGKWNFDAPSQFLHKQMMSVVIPRVEAINGNGHHGAYQEQPAEPQWEPPAKRDAPLASRESLVADIGKLCGELNAAGDDRKWTKQVLHQFVNETYQVEDGIESLSTPFLIELKVLLSRRLLDLDVPF